MHLSEALDCPGTAVFQKEEAVLIKTVINFSPDIFRFIRFPGILYDIILI